MIQLRQLVPTNYQQEKAKFFADHSYNPQFTYESNFTPDELTSYGLPKSNLLILARKICDNKKSQVKEITQKVILSDTQVAQQIQDYLKPLGIEAEYRVRWSSDFILRISVTDGEIRVLKNAHFSQQELPSVLNHEVGTHVIRRINDAKQPWHGHRGQFELRQSLRTEEGLATIHSLIAREPPSAHSAASRYLTVEYALHHSFAETWQYLYPYFGDEDKCWRVTMKQKRGLSDTSLPGAYTKDVVYFEGLIYVWKWLNDHGRDATPLYLGKLDCEDALRMAMLVGTNNLLIPHFMKEQLEYAKKIQYIGEYNQLGSIG